MIIKGEGAWILIFERSRIRLTAPPRLFDKQTRFPLKVITNSGRDQFWIAIKFSNNSKATAVTTHQANQSQ